MADETREEREERIAQELNDQYREEGEKVAKAASKARDDEPNDEGFASQEEYREHVANVPGIFGDTDTLEGDVVSHNNEAATVAVAEVDASTDDDAEELSHDQARRQVDAGTIVPSAEQVEEGAEDSEDDKKDDKKEEDKKGTAARKGTRKNS
jgi:hypothetical protein